MVRVGTQSSRAPLGWRGADAGLRLATAAHAEERVTRRPARLAAPLYRLTGG